MVRRGSETRQRSQAGDRSGRIFYLPAALILLQKSAFSLNDSHAFNRADDAHTQH
jgi:hypothetical protein